MAFPIAHDMLKALKKAAWLLWLLCFFCEPAFSQSKKSSKEPLPDPFPAIPVNINDHLKVFDDSTGKQAAVYFISVCADVPNNKKPLRVAYQQETGHVFLVLQKISVAKDTISSVFGFYPRGELQTLLFKKTKSVIKDNSHREHDVSITREISAEQFDTVLAKAILYSQKKYHMNKYNCYDYAIDIFNSVAGKDSLPLLHVRFPFIFGKGGSPCSVYRSFKTLMDSGSFWSANIRFGEMIAPMSTARNRKSPVNLAVNQ